jgi:tetratricopeptide (TPR) repeat protein
MAPLVSTGIHVHRPGIPWPGARRNRMTGRKLTAVAAVALLLGFVLGTLSAADLTIVPDLWEGRTPEEASKALLEASAVLAGDGSWENIHLARVYYLSGDKDKGEAILQRYQGGEPSDLVRIARVYAEAGDWDKAEALYDRVVALKPKDEDWLAEAGAWYNLNGSRERAEDLFRRSFDEAPKNLKNALAAAGSYVGVEPRDR